MARSVESEERPQAFYSDGIRKFVDHWARYNEKHGNCKEKQDLHNFGFLVRTASNVEY
jgi:hypothetical protein